MSKLFEKIKIGSLEIKNRFVMPAMDCGLTTEDHRFSKDAIAYYAERAKGGFGLQITEYMAVCPQGVGNANEVALWDDEFIPNLKELTDAIHENGGKIFGQLHHIGMMGKTKNVGEIVGPSWLASNNQLEKTRELTTEEIYTIINQFIEAAERVKRAGFDGCEIHGAHGYLIAQFLSRATNKRVDEFGGSFENRFRIAKLIIEGIKENCGTDFPVSFRFNVNEFIEHGNDIHDALVYAQLAQRAGADVLHVSNGTGMGGYIAAPHYFQQAYNMDGIEKIKKEVSIPVIAVGRISDPEVARYLVETGKCDLVALGRASICDPHYPEKLLNNETDTLFQCTGCIQRCWYAGYCEENDIGVSCMMNPFSGKESKWKIEEAEEKKKIVIIGAGPAGLEAGWILAKRGHEVTIYEKNGTPGGNYRLAAIPPHKQDLAKTIHTYTSLCKKYGAKIIYNFEMDDDKLATLECNELIVATGSIPFIPGFIPGIEKTVLANDILLGKCLLAKKKVLVLGGGLVGCETAELLAWYRCDVDIIEMRDSLAPEAVSRSRAVLLDRLNQANVNAYLNSKVIEVTNDGVIAEINGKEKSLSGYDAVVLSLGYRNYSPLKEKAETLFGQEHVHIIGDAKKARDAKMAIYEAAKLGIIL